MKKQFGFNLRRLRQNQHIRELCQDVSISHKQLIQPYFVVEGLHSPDPIEGLPGVQRENAESLLTQIEGDIEQGVNKILLFAVPQYQHQQPENFDFTARQVESIKKKFGNDVWLAVDVCLCSHTDHGHCGLTNKTQTAILNHESVELLAKQALTFAQAGADCIAPSDMMDSRVAAIRNTLDDHDLDQTLIMSYAVKYHSCFYGPFRNAAESTPRLEQLKDRATYQINPATKHDAFLCAERDLNEGADILMIKPGLLYLDVLNELSKQFKKPWAVYQVSGEYASIELLAAKGLIDRQKAHLETWLAFKRAGARMIITYGARFAKHWLKDH